MKIDCTKQQLKEFATMYSLSCLPSRQSDNPRERVDAHWIDRMRFFKANQNNPNKERKTVWFPILDQIATEIGWSGIFDELTPEQIAIERFRKIVAKYSLDKNK